MSVTDVEKRTAAGGGARGEAVLKEAGRRRTFAVISHPDAGKSTLTEALALHASAINTRGCGARQGRAARRYLRLDGDGEAPVASRLRRRR